MTLTALTNERKQTFERKKGVSLKSHYLTPAPVTWETTKKVYIFPRQSVTFEFGKKSHLVFEFDRSRLLIAGTQTHILYFSIG
jgi:hypothetical protein